MAFLTFNLKSMKMKWSQRQGNNEAVSESNQGKCGNSWHGQTQPGPDQSVLHHARM